MDQQMLELIERCAKVSREDLYFTGRLRFNPGVLHTKVDGGWVRDVTTFVPCPNLKAYKPVGGGAPIYIYE